MMIVGDDGGGGEEGGGGGGVLICCLQAIPINLSIDHAPLSRRRTVPAPNNGDTSDIWVLVTRFFHILNMNCVLILSPSRFAVCGHHLSPRIAVVFSLLSSLCEVVRGEAQSIPTGRPGGYV